MPNRGAMNDTSSKPQLITPNPDDESKTEEVSAPLKTLQRSKEVLENFHKIAGSTEIHKSEKESLLLVNNLMAIFQTHTDMNTWGVFNPILHRRPPYLIIVC